MKILARPDRVTDYPRTLVSERTTDWVLLILCGQYHCFEMREIVGVRKFFTLTDSRTNLTYVSL